MKIAVYGLGYVGTVSAAAIAALGHEVMGVDTTERKVVSLLRGESPVLEPGLAELVAAERASGRLDATTNGEAAAASTDVSLICVGTPSRPNGSLGTDAVAAVDRRWAAALRHEAAKQGVTVAAIFALTPDRVSPVRP